MKAGIHQLITMTVEQRLEVSIGVVKARIEALKARVQQLQDLGVDVDRATLAPAPRGLSVLEYEYFSYWRELNAFENVLASLQGALFKAHYS